MSIKFEESISFNHPMMAYQMMTRRQGADNNVSVDEEMK